MNFFLQTFPNTNEEEKYRRFFTTIFLSVLLFSIISTLLIYYFIRYKKKPLFDAAGRKEIENTRDYQNLISFMELIFKEDDIIKLEQEVVSK